MTMSYRTVDGTARTSDSDYIAKTGTLTFAPGETTKTITIEVNGDNKKEACETFYLDLFANSSNSLFTKSRGVGTILNDDCRTSTGAPGRTTPMWLSRSVPALNKLPNGRPGTTGQGAATSSAAPPAPSLFIIRDKDAQTWCRSRRCRRRLAVASARGYN
jgi:hypothetical protein